MITLLALLTYPYVSFTDTPCQNHVNLNRVEVHVSEHETRHGCWMQYQNLKIYVMDDENEYVILKEDETRN